MVASLVSEIILCVKERNKATRGTAFDLLVQIAHAMHEAEPPSGPGGPGGGSDDDDMGEPLALSLSQEGSVHCGSRPACSPPCEQPPGSGQAANPPPHPTPATQINKRTNVPTIATQITCVPPCQAQRARQGSSPAAVLPRPP